MSTRLESINSPQDLRTLSILELNDLAQQVRDFIISNVAATGGHLAPSLGVVELTLALHYIFDTPKDKLIWDVGHQAYTHKIITGRRDQFNTLRQYKGISGFPKISESEYDAFGVGHSSTSISAGLGIACARDILGQSHHVISIIGDGALTGGLAYEGLNNAGASEKNIIVILNDNSMSISPNVGALSKYLTDIISNPLYNRIKKEVWDVTGKMENMGPVIRKTAKRLEQSIKALATPGVLFERMGFRYFGPINGHDIEKLCQIFGEVKKLNGPILMHVQTKKGKGFEPAENNASKFHGLGKFDPRTGELSSKGQIPSYTQVFGQTLVDLAKQDEKIVGITAAMQLGTGLDYFSKTFPDRFYDVGIAEAHAVTFSGGLAAKGLKPVCAIYSSFLQRAYDQIFHDIALQKLPVVFGIDRAGIVGDDGPTHHGVFDLAYLRVFPNLIIMAPKDEAEMQNMLYTALSYDQGPVAIRYPRGQGEGVPLLREYKLLPIGKSEVMRQGYDVTIIAAGFFAHRALQAAEILAKQDISVGVVNVRFIKPIDREMLLRVAQQTNIIITIEDGTLKGGLGSEVAEFYADQQIDSVHLIRMGVPDEFIEHGTRDILYSDLGLTVEKIIENVQKCVVPAV